MKFKPFQIHDYAAAAMVDGLIGAHDTGLGKSLKAVTWPLLKCGFNVVNGAIRVKAPVLIVAPGDLHDQLRQEFKKFYNIVPTSIDDQEGLQRLLVNRKLPPGFYLTSYTRLTTNNVKKIGDLNKISPEAALAELNLKTADLQSFYNNRGLHYKDEYGTLGLTPDCTRKQLDGALFSKLRVLKDWSDQKAAEARRGELHRCHEVLENLVGSLPVTSAALFRDAATPLQWLWRELLRHKLREYSEGVGEIRDGIKCVYSPSVADLGSHLFECMGVDEGVKMKGSNTQVGRGIRQMCPKFRMVLTATPVKNRLPDIFWLAWWAAGGNEEATARWRYAGGADEQEKFAATFMLSEFNKTKAATDPGKKSRFKKLRPEICNLRLLWKALGPIVLRRRKSDIGQSIVKKIRHVYRVPMGAHQRSVYQYHLNAEYLDCNRKPAPGAKLQALRVAAAAPDSHLLEPQTFRQGMMPKNPIHRSPFSFTPKVACALTLIRDILQRGEQVAVFSAFNDPSDILSRYLEEAGIDHHILDGRTNQRKRGAHSAAFNRGECPVILAGLDSMAEGHNWDNINNIIATSYTWACDREIQSINRAHRLTSKKDLNVYRIICDQSADRVLEDNINEKTNSSELAIDGQLLGEAADERSVSELLRDAMRDFKEKKDCPNEEDLVKTWPALREQLREAARLSFSARSGERANAEGGVRCPEPIIDLAAIFEPPVPQPAEKPLQPQYIPSWRRIRLNPISFLPKTNITPVIGPANKPSAQTAWVQPRSPVVRLIQASESAQPRNKEPRN